MDGGFCVADGVVFSIGNPVEEFCSFFPLKLKEAGNFTGFIDAPEVFAAKGVEGIAFGTYEGGVFRGG